jgi:hypothetical protein
MDQPPHSPEKRPAHFGLRRYSAAEFLVTLILLIVATPFVGDLAGGRVIESALMTLVFLAGVLAVGRRRRTLVIACIFVIPAISGKWVNHIWPNLMNDKVFFSAGLLFAIFLVIQLLMFILRAPRVNSEVVCAALSIYFMLGLCWMFAYLIVDRLSPHSFAYTVGPAPEVMDRFTCYYFSYSTLSTLGYGDIVPVSRVARMLAAMEAMTGTLFIAVLIARLVAVYSTQPPAAGTNDPANGGK